jgi:hypothetical protein
MQAGPDSLAVAVRRMRLAAEGFGLDRRAAKEASNTVASEVVARVYLRDAVDIAELAESSLRRLQRVDILGSAPRVAADVDVVEVAAAMRRAWNGAR